MRLNNTQHTYSIPAGGCPALADRWLFDLSSGLCGSDRKTYRDKDVFECVQGTEYGKRVSLQLSHKGACFEWYLLWRSAQPFLIVSKMRIDLNLMGNYFIFDFHSIAALFVSRYSHWRMLDHLSGHTIIPAAH